MTLAERERAANEAIHAQYQELWDLVEDALRDGDARRGLDRLGGWKKRTISLLREQVHPDEAKHFETKQQISFRTGEPLQQLEDTAGFYGGFLEALGKEIKQHPRELLEGTAPEGAAGPDALAPSGREPVAVFLIHGRDEHNAARLEQMIRDRMGLQPLVLSPAGTLIEEFRGNARGAAFAFVLIGPDDQIENDRAEPAPERPGLAFELGWFHGRLGPDRVCVLLKGGARLHRDLDGIARVEFDGWVDEVSERIERVLLDAGVLQHA